MRDPVPSVDCRYGAPMGRGRSGEGLRPEAGRIHLRRIRLDAGGYDAGGAYWGGGQTLWYVEDGDGNSEFFRAINRHVAKRIVRDQLGVAARFYR